jgi:FixJ family two-component response regulator
MQVREHGRRKTDPSDSIRPENQTVFIVDDDAAVREAIAILVGSVDLYTETFDSGTAFLDGYSPERSGCLVLDVRMRGLGGLELQQVLNQLNYDIPIIFITGHGDVSLAVQAMRAGAFDFLEKPFRDQYLLERVNQALQLDLDRRRGRVERAVIQGQLARLTPREREVMERIVQGQPNKVVAIELGLSERTVEIHRAKVMAKAGARSLAELIGRLARCDRP